MATTHMVYDDRRARTELGYTSVPARAALARAARWYFEHGYIKGPHMERIRRAGTLERKIDPLSVPEAAPPSVAPERTT